MTAPIPALGVRRYTSTYVLLHGWLTNVVGYPNITRTVPTNVPYALPLIVVDKIGGADDVPTIDSATVDIDVYCPDHDTAEAHAEHIRTQLRTRLVGYQTPTTVVTRVETVTAPTQLPWDSRAQVVRYGGTYRIRTHQFGGL